MLSRAVNARKIRRSFKMQQSQEDTIELIRGRFKVEKTMIKTTTMPYNAEITLNFRDKFHLVLARRVCDKTVFSFWKFFRQWYKYLKNLLSISYSSHVTEMKKHNFMKNVAGSPVICDKINNIYGNFNTCMPPYHVTEVCY